MSVFIIKYRWWILGISLALAAGFGAAIPFSETDPDIRNYVPASLKSRMETDSIEKVFGVQDIVLLIFHDSCIINHDELQRINNIDHAISRFNGVSSRISPFTVRSIKGSEGTLLAEKLIGILPEDSSEIASLEHHILENRFAKDIAVSSDMSSAAITATINTRVPEPVTLHRIDSAISANPGRSEVLKGGLPYIRSFVTKDVRDDALILVPAALVIMLLILKLTLGDWRSVMMPFSVVVLSTVISMGLLTVFGWKMSILTLLVPIILIAVGNNYGIYLVARYQDLTASSPGSSGRSVLRELLKSLNMPILFSGLTTIAGILGLLSHSVIPARQVGLLAATGVSVALLMSLLLIPALISMQKPKKSKKPGRHLVNNLFDRILAKLSSLIIRYPGRILIISAAATLLISLGSILLKTDTNQENYFPSGHPVRKASEMINSRFGGSQTISVMVSGNIKDPGIMRAIDDLTTSVESIKGVGRVFSISQVVREISKAFYDANDPGSGMIPSSGEAIAQLFELYNMSGDPVDFTQLMNLDNTRAHILIKLSQPSNEVIANVKEIIREKTVDFPAKMDVGGYAIVMADFAESIISGQISSLLIALVTVFILLTIIFKSLKGGLAGSIPLGASILILFGFMGLAGIALDAATALLSSIMIGVGVDFTIQYVWCLNGKIREGNDSISATQMAIQTIGRSIIINAFSVMAGFSALMLSQFTSIRFFGYLVLISIGSCLLGAIVVIPAFIVWFKPDFVMKDLGYNSVKIPWCSFVKPFESFVFNLKIFKHKGAQRIAQRAQRDI
jgi:uncharacterized protein